MGTSTGHVLTLANSIIGVSVLAMPFCFKQCGIVLSILMLLLSSVMTRLACHYLLKSAINARRRNYEFLAFHVFGPSGKLFVELGIIGFMLGTCIAFFVVMGDLGPVIIGPALNIDSYSTLRPSVLLGLGLLVVLPLGLLRNVDSLSAVCAASIAFYLCLVLKVMGEATTHLISWDWIENVNLWRPSGIPRCLPIFAMALSCQTQLFEIFDSVPNTSLDNMNAVIKSAINICTSLYIAVGVFGYIAFCTQNFSGNLLMSFSSTLTSEVIKLGFVLSVAVSFPLVIFPCRASLHSLLFRRGHTPHYELLSGGSNYIPEPRFKCLTIFIVMFSLGTGLLIPSIEVVLGLVGSTIGIIICILFPALTFICISNKNNNDRLVAQGLFAIGLVVMVLGTYTNLYATEEALSKPSIEVVKVVPPPLKPPLNIADFVPDVPNISKEKQGILDSKLLEPIPDKPKDEKSPVLVESKKEVILPESIPSVEDSNKRKEPPIPVAPGDTVIKDTIEINVPPVPSDVSVNKIDEVKPPTDLAIEIKKEETISNDAIKREEEEIKESKIKSNNDVVKKQEEILGKLIKQGEESEKILQQHRELLKELKKQNEVQQMNLQENKNIVKQANLNGNNETPIKLSENIIKETLKNEEPQFKNKNIAEKAEVPKEILDKNSKVNNVANPIKDNVKLDFDKNLSVNNNHIENPIKNVVAPVKDNSLTPLMTKKMVKGVPLPLAVKEDIVEKKTEDKAKKDALKVDDSLNNKPQVRDILGENRNMAKEDREKRDLDTVVKMDNRIDLEPKLTNKEGEVISSIVKEVTPINSILNNAGISVKNDLISNSGVINQNLIKENNAIKDDDKGVSLVQIVNEDIKKEDKKQNCPKPEKDKKSEDLNEISRLNIDLPNEGNKEIGKENKIENKELHLNEREKELIKTPSYLSDPEVPLINVANVQEGNPLRNLAQEMKPLSRDLKSIQNPPGTRRDEESVGEIT